MQNKLSQVQAARAAGVSRATIYRAIKSGRLSMTQETDGGMHIDASELLRVFPDADLERAREHAPDGQAGLHEQGDVHADEGELRALRELISELKEDKAHLRQELERAAAERAEIVAERTRLLSMLEEKDRVLAQQLEQVRLLTDARTQRKPWWKRWW
jgi:AcrR family transcriptional regulator